MDPPSWTLFFTTQLYFSKCGPLFRWPLFCGPLFYGPPFVALSPLSWTVCGSLSSFTLYRNPLSKNDSYYTTINSAVNRFWVHNDLEQISVRNLDCSKILCVYVRTFEFESTTFGNYLASLYSWTFSIFVKLTVRHFRISTTCNSICCIFAFVPLSKTATSGSTSEISGALEKYDVWKLCGQQKNINSLQHMCVSKQGRRALMRAIVGRVGE